MDLTELALLLLPAIHPAAPKQPDAAVIAQAMAQAVAADGEEPITGSKEGDLALGLRFAWDESNLRMVDSRGECLTGDGGKALGPLQLQHTPAALACAPAPAAKIWLAMAHGSARRCSTLEEGARLAALASGNCDHGREVSRRRMRAARAALVQAIKL